MTDDVRALIIPTPTRLERGDGTYTLAPDARVEGAADDVRRLLSIVGPGAGLLPGEGAKVGIRLVRTDAAGSSGSYDLTVDATGVTMTYGDDAGLAAAIATLRQLLPAWTFAQAPLVDAPLTLPCVTVHDEPRFTWRGQHLDVARHFMPYENLLRFVDVMHLHKLNVLHLHLTDDQGWRFPVSSMPKLTEVGAWRSETHPHLLPDGDGTPHGGYYTHDQLRGLVAYAAVRGIDVMPEIDLPGHVRALLAAYPEYGEGEALPVATTFRIFDEVLHLSDETVAMCERLVDELTEVFPSAYIHLGGDECPKTQWQNSDAAAELARERGLESVDHLQRWFTEHMFAYVTSKGRTFAGWGEILDEGPLPGALVHAWRGHEQVARTAAQGNEMVISNSDRLYFDYYASSSDDEPRAIGGLITWQDVLAYDPFDEVPADRHDIVKGIQCQLWTEYMPNPQHVDYMAHPRQAAFAEVAWHGSGTDATAFESSLAADFARLDARGVTYRPLAGPLPWQQGGTGRQRRL